MALSHALFNSSLSASTLVQIPSDSVEHFTNESSDHLIESDAGNFGDLASVACYYFVTADLSVQI